MNEKINTTNKIDSERQKAKRAPFAGGVDRVRHGVVNAYHSVKEHPIEAGATVAGAALATASIFTLVHQGEGGNDHLPPTFEIIKAHQIITLEQGATIRFDPVVTGPNDAPNDVLHLDAPIDVDSMGRIENTNNGTWYVVTGDALLDGLNGSQPKNIVDEIKGDEDNRLFINEDGVLVKDVEPKSDNPDDYAYPSNKPKVNP